jgi:hypothetical protein
MPSAAALGSAEASPSPYPPGLRGRGTAAASLPLATGAPAIARGAASDPAIGVPILPFVGPAHEGAAPAADLVWRDPVGRDGPTRPAVPAPARATPAPTAPAPAVDVVRLAEQVQALIERRIRGERSRRGG